MNKKNNKSSKNFYYILITGLLIYIMFIMSPVLPWDSYRVARFSKVATSAEHINITIFFWLGMAIINCVVAFIVRHWKKAFFVLSMALTVTCILNCIGAFMLY